MASLAPVLNAGALEPYPLHVELALLHCPFDDLDPPRLVEAEVELALSRGERVAVIGSSGAGKSSVIAYVTELNDQLAPIQVPVVAMSREAVGEPVQVVAQVLQQLSRPSTPTIRVSGLKARIGLPWLNVEVTAEVARASEVAPKMAPQAAELLDQALQIVKSKSGRDPVLIFDDTDRWLSALEDARPTRRAFFQQTFRWITETVDVPVIVAVHPSYLEEDGATPGVSGTVHVPSLISSDQLAAILDHRLEAVGVKALTAAAVFDVAALNELYRFYIEAGHRSLREVMALARRAVAEADDAGEEQVGVLRLHAATVL